MAETATLAVTGLADTTVAENAAFTSWTPGLTGTPIGAVTWSKEGTDEGDFGIDAGTGVLSMVARDYESPEDEDQNNDYEVTVKVTDADGNAAMASITVSVTDVAETATLAVTGLVDTTVAENAAFTSWTPGITGTPIGDVTWTAEGTDASDFDIDGSTGVLSMVARDYEAPVDADSGNDYEVTVKATDADGNAAMVSITVSVTDVAETATLAVTGLADTTVAENVAFTSWTPGITGTPIGAVTWSKEGTDAGDFDISSTGVLSMVARDFESPEDEDQNNDYEVTVKVTDADGNAAMASITVSVTDVAETATLAVTGLADTTVAENAAFTSWTPGITGTPVGAVTWSKEGTDEGDFGIDAGTGVLSMVARDFESPEDEDQNNDYEVTVKVTDADGNAAMASITVSVTDVAETATLAVTGLVDTTVAENAAFTSWTPGITGTPVGAVTWSKEGTDAADFDISSTGVLSMVARDFESPRG